MERKKAKKDFSRYSVSYLVMMLLISSTFCACGGNDSGTAGTSSTIETRCDVGVFIKEPTWEDTFTATSNPVVMGGIVHPDFPKVIWHNATTGGSGTASVYEPPVGYWGSSLQWAAYIHLVSGSNQITVEAFDSTGKLRGRDCVTINL